MLGWELWDSSGRDSFDYNNERVLTSFNPRAHGGRDGSGGTIEIVTEVSIHAPTGGATYIERGVIAAQGVSIHAPTGGATTQRWRTRLLSLCFNPRAHGGRDPHSFSCINFLRSFNPRAHGGRDDFTIAGIPVWRCFNPRAHGGRDVLWGLNCY